jgi:hypothetical protein
VCGAASSRPEGPARERSYRPEPLPPPPPRPRPAQGQRAPDYDLATACTKKEGRKLTKMECMVHYHEARVPFWNGKGSDAWRNAEKTREMIDGLKTKVKSRWEEQHGVY